MKKLVFLLVFAILLTGCAQPATPDVAPTPTMISLGGALDTLVAPRTATPSATPEATMTPAPPWGEWPGPIRVRGDEPPPVRRIGDLPGRRAYLILGADWREGRETYNTDTIILALANTEDNFVSLVSIPRDLLVFVPGLGMSRINQVFALLGWEGMRDTISYNFGIEPLAYAVIDMQAFERVVDRVGGIDVSPEADLDERCWGTDFDLLAGHTYHLDGRHAMCYARNRGTTDDFSRMARQQEVLYAIFRQLTRYVIQDPTVIVDITTDLFNVYERYVGTNAFLPRETETLLLLLPWEAPRTYVIGDALTTPFADSDLGPWLLLPNFDVRYYMEEAAQGRAWQ